MYLNSRPRLASDESFYVLSGELELQIGDERSLCHRVASHGCLEGPHRRSSMACGECSKRPSAPSPSYSGRPSQTDVDGTRLCPRQVRSERAQ